MLLEAIEAERSHEEEYYKNLVKSRSLQDRISSGFLWWPVKVMNRQLTLGEYVEIEIERTKMHGEPHKLRVGAGARLFKENRNDDYSGVISFIRRDTLKLLVKSDHLLSDNDIQYGLIGVELIYDERPYKLMRQAIHDLLETKDRNLQELREDIRKENRMPTRIPYKVSSKKFNKALNDSQENAIEEVGASAQIGIIHGPPGTGKTTTLVELITRLAQTEKKILVCAPSNNAVDLLASLLHKNAIPVLRIGNMSRISDDLVHLSLSEKARNHSDWKHIKKVRIEAQEARKLAGQYKRSFGEAERSDRKTMRREAKELRKWANDLEDMLMDKLINEARVICSTLIGASHKSINSLRYDTLIIDEASQALEPECWNAMLKSKRTILSGDHLQLPPVVKSPEAKKLGLDVTLLDHLSGKIHYDHLLDTQYRMNGSILQFSNANFYENRLKSHESVVNRKLTSEDSPFVFIDTSGCGFTEEFDPKRRSYRNSQEWYLLREYILIQKEKQLPHSIGLISPYGAQVNFLRTEVSEDKDLEGLQIEVNTIDGFQGQEKDVIYISLVRSNDQGQIGFLADERRLNVAMTRARMKLVMIGDLSTLSSSPLFNRLADFIEENQFYKSAWEYMAY